MSGLRGEDLDHYDEPEPTTGAPDVDTETTTADDGTEQGGA